MLRPAKIIVDFRIAFAIACALTLQCKDEAAKIRVIVKNRFIELPTSLYSTTKHPKDQVTDGASNRK